MHGLGIFVALFALLTTILPGCGGSGDGGGAGSGSGAGGAETGLPQELPLLVIADLVYQGAFRLSAGEYGVSSLNYSEGPIAVDSELGSLFIVGHNHQQAVAEFSIPELMRSESLADLNMSEAPLQEFFSILDRADGGNPQGLDRIGGLCWLGPRSLVVNAYEYYDAPGDNTQTTLVLSNARDLQGSPAAGYYSFMGGAGHTSGWISPIPAEWQELLGGSYLTGQSSGIPIIGRTSVGPSAFAFHPEDLVAHPPGPVSTAKLLDFSLDHPLHEDLSNATGSNSVWTHLSRVTFGMIVPGTRTYLTIGYSGGHSSGVCYKCTQSNGYVCGGYCAPDPEDYVQSYWLWDVNDLVQVKRGEQASHDPRPYDFGPFPTPFQTSTRQIGGGAWDPTTGRLYLTIQQGDHEQGTYSNPPVVVVYGFARRGD